MDVKENFWFCNLKREMSERFPGIKYQKCLQMKYRRLKSEEATDLIDSAKKFLKENNANDEFVDKLIKSLLNEACVFDIN